MAMYETISNQELENMNLSQITAIHQKRTLAFINHFITTTVQFLNSFMKKCEMKLLHFERKLEKVDASLILLEARLSSIPEVNLQETEQTNLVEPSSALSELKENVDGTSTSEYSDKISEALTYPEYDRFVKMVQVGVPLQAVKLKLSLEGLDPAVFDSVLKK